MKCFCVAQLMWFIARVVIAFVILINIHDISSAIPLNVFFNWITYSIVKSYYSLLHRFARNFLVSFLTAVINIIGAKMGLKK